MEITGTIKEINSEEQINDTLKKRTFVIEDDSKYHNSVLFELIGDKTDIIEYYTEGQQVEVMFSIRSRKSGERWFTSCIAYSIKPVQ